MTQDPIEQIVREALPAETVVDGFGDTKNLDFYIPSEDVYIEVCRYYTPRKIEQASRAENVIIVQGKKAAEYFASLAQSQSARVKRLEGLADKERQEALDALNDIVTAYCMSLGMKPPIPDEGSQTARQVKTIRRALQSTLPKDKGQPCDDRPCMYCEDGRCAK